MGSFVTDVVVHSPIAMHIEDHVRVPAEHVTEPACCPSQHMEPSYESTYKEVHKVEFQRIRSLVQTPNVGTFMHTDLTWASHMHTKGRRTDPRTLAPVMVAYIPWARVEDFVKGEETRNDAPCKFVCQGIESHDKGKLLFPTLKSYSCVIRCVCNMQVRFHSTCSRVTICCQVSTMFYMHLTSTTCCSPHPTGITVNMDQKTLPATYHWLQMTCYTRNENSMRRANSFQVERGTTDLGHLRECGAPGNDGDASVDLSSSNCTWSLQWLK